MTALRAGSFRSVYRGDGPAFSRELGAWIVVTDNGRRLRIADDAAGTKCWPTVAEQERHAQEQAHAVAEVALAQAEAERHAREQAEAEVARLRALLDAGGAPTRKRRK